MTHLRRIAMPRSFPLKRKGRQKYVVASIGNDRTIPLLLILRDICKVVTTRREARIILRGGDVFVNCKKTCNDKLSINLFDTVSIPRLNKHYRVIFDNNKFALKEISEKESGTRICKIINKKVISKDKVQLNLDNGYNIISDLKAAVNDSIIFDFKTRKILKHLPLKEKVNVEVVGGSHTGLKGIVNEIKENKVELKTEDKKLQIPVKNILVVENEK